MRLKTVVLLNVVLVDATITLKRIDGSDSLSLTVYNTLPWQTSNSAVFGDVLNPNMSRVPLIPMHDLIPGVFNPCDITSYVPGVMDSLVRSRYNATSSQVSQATGESETLPWIAVNDYILFGEACNGWYPTMMFYDTYVTFMAQQMGASAVIISGTSSPETQKGEQCKMLFIGHRDDSYAPI